jgi:large subunit ribosomal protein L13
MPILLGKEKMKTYSTRISEVKREWQVVDADGQILGRLAVQIANMLMGKRKTIYVRNLDTGDYVVVINAAKIRVTGKKMQDKFYYSHSNYPGGFKSVSLADMMAKDPTKAIEEAVKGMLPHTRLGAVMLGKLKVYSGNTHPHEAQVKQVAPAPETA